MDPLTFNLLAIAGTVALVVFVAWIDLGTGPRRGGPGRRREKTKGPHDAR